MAFVRNGTSELTLMSSLPMGEWTYGPAGMPGQENQLNSGINSQWYNPWTCMGGKPRSVFTNPSSYYVRTEQGCVDFGPPEEAFCNLSLDPAAASGAYGYPSGDCPMTPEEDEAARQALERCLYGPYPSQFCHEEQPIPQVQVSGPYNALSYPYETGNGVPPAGFQEEHIPHEVALPPAPPSYPSPDVMAAQGSVYVTQWGTLILEMHQGCMIELTVDQSFRITNSPCNITLVLSTTGTTSGMLHPNGRIHQYDSRVEVKVYDHEYGNHKVAKMWYKGVSFTSEKCALVYLVDQAGTRTTTDYFADLDYDFSQDILFNGARHGAEAIEECCRLLNSHTYYKTASGTEVWLIGGVKIFQSDKGVVRATRENNKRVLRTSPGVGTASITTPIIHATASMGQSPHMFVRRGERRLHTDLLSFVARNAGHSAGFDEPGRLKVY